VAAFVLDLLLIGSLAALSAAAFRVASTLTPSGLERALAASVLVAAAIVVEALALGLVGLSGTPVALCAGALLTWLGVRSRFSAPELSAAAEIGSWWADLSPRSRAGIGAAAGLGVGILASILRRPEPGYDGLTYHLPEVVAFVQSGHAGTVITSNYGLPVGSYPITNEVLLSWLTGISRGFSALTVWTPVSAGLLVLAGWAGMRRLGVAAGIRTLALAALIAGPLLVVALPQPGTDLPALSWLACCATLCLASAERPALLAPALLAFGLAAGTKTTAASLGVVVLGAALWVCRRSLAQRKRELALGAVGALIVGGTWYIRNLIAHGSPLWPFYATSWGTPVPQDIRLVSPTMLGHLQSTLFDHLSAYTSGISGSTVLVLAGVFVPLLARRRRSLLAAGAVALGALAWANAPVTGAPEIAALAVGARSSIRYLLPVFAAGSVALAVAAGDGSRPVRGLALLALAGALAWGLVTDAQHSFYVAGGWGLLVLGAGAGAVVAALVAPARLPRFGRLALAAMLSVALAASASGFIARHAAVPTEIDASLSAVLGADPAYANGHAPVAAAPFIPGLLAGDTLAHRVTLISEHASCAEVLARARRGLIVIDSVDNVPIPGHPHLVLLARGTAPACLAGQTPRLTVGSFRIYGPEL